MSQQKKMTTRGPYRTQRRVHAEQLDRFTLGAMEHRVNLRCAAEEFEGAMVWASNKLTQLRIWLRNQ